MRVTPDSVSESAELAQALHWLLPLHFFYEKHGRPLPDFHFLDGKEVPYPYRSLLVHENDMTPTLAAFHHSKLYLEVHEKEVSDEFVMRLVTLHAAASDIPVEFGAIGIHLQNFTEDARKLVLDGEVPLGAILGECHMNHHGSPCAYFKVPADDLMADTLKQAEGDELFGRCNQLLDAEGLVIADIVEILPRSNESERWVGDVNGK